MGEVRGRGASLGQADHLDVQALAEVDPGRVLRHPRVSVSALRKLVTFQRHQLYLVSAYAHIFSKTKHAVRLIYRAGYSTFFVFCVGNTFANVFGFPAGVAGVSMSKE